MPTILVVDDDPAILSGVATLLEQAGYQTMQANTGSQARQMLTATAFDLIVLDIMLPDDDGMDVCRLIRQQPHYTPILMVSAKDQTHDKVQGLDLGADDYITKPFEPSELMARVRAILRLANQRQIRQTVLEYHELTLYLEQHTAFCNGQNLDLSSKEWAVLHLLLQQPEHVVGRTAIINHVWETDYLGGSRMVDMCVLRLRSKIEQFAPDVQFIQTVRGIGYKLQREER